MPIKHELPYFATYQPTLTLDQDRGKYVSRPVRPPSQSGSSYQPKKISIVLILIFSVFAFYLGALFYFAFPFKFSHTIDRDLHDVRILYNLVDVQNKTINTLMTRVKSMPYLQSFYDKKKSSSSDLTTMALHQAKRHDSMTKRERDCEMRYGLSLADEWRGTEETWCQSETNMPGKVSSLKCYPYQQQHRAEQGKGKDVFCVAENFVIDFSLIIGDVAPDGTKLFNGLAYLDVTMNTALQATCKRTPAYSLDTFAPHTNKFFMNFRDGVEEPTFDVFEETTTYFLPRDEDSENTFHSQADFLNMYLVKDILAYDVSEQQVLIMDKMPNNPYQELLERAFAPVHGVHRHGKYQRQRVMFKKMIFHLESPASLIFPETSTRGPQRCRDSTFFDAYRRHVLQSFNLLEVEPPSVPTASLLLRHRTAWKNVGRVMANEDEVVTAFQKEGNMMRTNVVDLASMSYGDQLRFIRSSNILVGVHGAGLMWIMFAADEAVLMEIHPSYREDRHFRHIARLMGKDYMPMRSLTRETCQLTSDNVLVAIPEFLDTLSAAVRLARSYDQGTSECGLSCPPAILGMDARLSDYFNDPTIANYQNTPRVKGLDKTFPCPGV